MDREITTRLIILTIIVIVIGVVSLLEDQALERRIEELEARVYEAEEIWRPSK